MPRLIEAEDDLTIAEVAYQLGFSSPAYFSTSFWGRYQLSPFEFRALHTTPNAYHEAPLANGSKLLLTSVEMHPCLSSLLGPPDVGASPPGPLSEKERGSQA